jgi:hypothetical protein
MANHIMAIHIMVMVNHIATNLMMANHIIIVIMLSFKDIVVLDILRYIFDPVTNNFIVRCDSLISK